MERARGRVGGAPARKAVGILAAHAEAMGPQPLVERARGAQHKQAPLDMTSLKVALDELAFDATKFREQSRPLLDVGDGKLVTSCCIGVEE